MVQSVKDFILDLANTRQIAEPIYEIGSRHAESQGRYADLRPIFEGKEYVGIDMQDGPGVDLVANIEELPLEDSRVGTLICVETIEHIWDVIRAFEEMHRVLREGGTLIISSCMNFPIHDHPSDYWRTTPECIRRLLVPFSQSNVRVLGGEKHPTKILAWAVK